MEQEHFRNDVTKIVCTRSNERVFIKLTKMCGDAIYFNVEHINTVEEYIQPSYDDPKKLVLVGSAITSNNGLFEYVKETPQEVLDRI